MLDVVQYIFYDTTEVVPDESMFNWQIQAQTAKRLYVTKNMLLFPRVSAYVFLIIVCNNYCREYYVRFIFRSL